MTISAQMHANLLIPTSPVFIEPACHEDYQAISAIYNEYILQGDTTMEEDLFDADRIQRWVSGFHDREKLFVLKNNEHFVIGWGVIKRFSDRAGYRTTCETSVYLTKRECGKGYGTIIKKHIFEECQKMGYHHLVARVLASNKASIAYNIRLGYEIAGIQKEVGIKNGQWEDVVLMQYIFK
ncbi:MAG: N-acetyltransferase [Saprospiraceae bacterium]|nr:N-acetyltransferase [Saprospiraceae bacterium]